MARGPLDHLADILEAVVKIRAYTKGGEAAFRRSPMVRDAVTARLIQIGQAVKSAQDEGLDLPALAPEVPWRSVAGLRDRLARKYWDADPAIVWGVVERDLGELESAVKSIVAGKRRRGRRGKRA